MSKKIMPWIGAMPGAEATGFPAQRDQTYFTKARYDGKCAETGAPIKKGDRIAYYPATTQVFSEQSEQAAALRGQEFARAWNIADAGY